MIRKFSQNYNFSGFFWFFLLEFVFKITFSISRQICNEYYFSNINVVYAPLSHSPSKKGDIYATTHYRVFDEKTMGGVAICAISSVITIFAAWITCVVSMATDYWISSNKVCFTFRTLVLWENSLNIYNGKVFLCAGLIIVSVSSLHINFAYFIFIFW